MSSDPPQKQTVNPEDIFSPASSPRTQQRRASYRFWSWASCASRSETEVPSTDTVDTVLPADPKDDPLDEIPGDGSESKTEEVDAAPKRADEKKTLPEVFPSHSKTPSLRSGEECVINVTESNSRILKLLDVDDSIVSDTSSQQQTVEEALNQDDGREEGSSRESSEEDCCRICHNSQQYPSDLVSPCHCTGSLGKMHVSCLNQWLQLSKRQQCELCGYKYTFVKESLRFVDFLRDPELKRTHRQLLWDLLSFALITPISVVSIILILLAGQQLDWHLSWDVIGLVTVGFAQLVAYTIWFRIAFQYHKKLWENWKNKNQVMKLVILKTPNRQPMATGGCVTKRKRNFWDRRRGNQRTTDNPNSLRFFKRYNINRPTFRRVH